MILNRLFGPYAPLYWAHLRCNVLVPQVLWFRRVRANVPALFVVALVVNIGMWLERFIIVVTSLASRFPAVVVGDVLSDRLGLGHYMWDDWAIFRPVVLVPPLPPDDLDLRDARACVGDRRAGANLKTLIAYGECMSYAKPA